jgi:hypothetical protein
MQLFPNQHGVGLPEALLHLLKKWGYRYGPIPCFIP